MHYFSKVVCLLHLTTLILTQGECGGIGTDDGHHPANFHIGITCNPSHYVRFFNLCSLSNNGASLAACPQIGVEPIHAFRSVRHEGRYKGVGPLWAGTLLKTNKFFYFILSLSALISSLVSSIVSLNLPKTSMPKKTVKVICNHNGIATIQVATIIKISVIHDILFSPLTLFI